MHTEVGLGGWLNEQAGDGPRAGVRAGRAGAEPSDGHTNKATREQVLPDPQNGRVRARAGEARRSMRNYLRETERPNFLAA